MWGIGATLGPYVMGYALTGEGGWHTGYRLVGAMQIVLTAILFFSLPLWKGRRGQNGAAAADAGAERENAGEEKALPQEGGRVLSLREIFGIPGAREVMLCFFCYCALEQTVGLWAGSYLNLHTGFSAEEAAGYASMFFIGITVGRGLSGFLTIKFNDTQMIRLGQMIIGAGVIVLLFFGGRPLALAGFILIGLGCAPVYPCIIHSTPEHFGAERSQAVIGVQMASAYVGTCLMPPVFGLLASRISVSLLPVYLLAILVLMFFMHERLVRKTGSQAAAVLSDDQK